MNKIRVICMLTFLLVQTGYSQLLWDGDASKGTGIFKLIGSNCGAPGSVTVVNDAEHGQVFRYYKPAESGRCESHGIKIGGSGYVFQNNSTYYIGWFTKLTNTVNNNAIFQWKVFPSPGPDDLNWPIAIKMIDGRLTMINRKAGDEVHTLWSTPFAENRWYHITLALRLSDVRDGGYVELWFNGVRQTFNNGSQRWACQLFDVDHVCPKWGVYGATGSDVIDYIDGLKIGRTYDDVKMPGSATPPAAPSALSASAISSSQINLSWADNSTDEAQFRIERSTNGGTTWTFLANAAVNATSYSNTGLSASTTYHYRVRAENSAGTSAFSNIANATTAGTIPTAPSGLTASAVSSSQINLAWSDNSGNETQFRIERSGDAGATWVFLANAAANATTYSNMGLAASTTYHYRVRAENAIGNSAFSNTANATTESSTTLVNVALNKTVTASSSDTNVPANAVDGSTATRWSASPMPQWLEVDLGALYDISKTEVVCYLDRAYQFTVETKTTSTGAYTTVVNRSTNTTPGTIAAPITNTFSPITARYVRINVTGASGYTGTWASIIEFRVFGVPATTSPSDIYIEAESGTITSPMQVQLGSTAFGGKYITVAAGNNSQTAPPATGRATYNFSVPSSGTYKVWGRVVAPTTGDDSFWVRMDGGAWINWNEIALTTPWAWDEVHDAANANTVVTFNLAAGSHTLDIAYREDGTQLDRLLVTNNLSLNPNTTTATEVASASPEQLEVASAAENIVLDASGIAISPNPVTGKTMIYYELKESGSVKLSIYNSTNHRSTVLVDEVMPAGLHKVALDARPLPNGIHIIRVAQKGIVRTAKLLKQ